jgi:23S rRNA pseudouridine955/2504/2580 synthase
LTTPITLTAAADDDRRRLDRILRKALPDMPLSAIHSLLRKDRILVDGVPERGSCRVRAGAVIQIPLVRGAVSPARPGATPPAGSPSLHILWEDADFLVLNKPAGLASHGPVGESADSLETLARRYLAPKLSSSLSFQPGPLHRLDKPVSGIMVFSKSLEGARDFSSLLRERRVRKTYLALLEGILPRDETWEDALIRKPGKSFVFPGGSPANGGAAPKEARTRVYPLAGTAAAGGLTLVRLELDTGRTHQIRVQAAAHGHPLAGDRKYGGAPRKGGFLLHAHSLELPGRVLPGLPRRLEAPLPEYFAETIAKLFGSAFAGIL